MRYIISTGSYRCPDYDEKTYVSVVWLRKKLYDLNYPYKTLRNDAKWHHYNKQYRLEIFK